MVAKLKVVQTHSSIESISKQQRIELHSLITVGGAILNTISFGPQTLNDSSFFTALNLTTQQPSLRLFRCLFSEVWTRFVLSLFALALVARLPLHALARFRTVVHALARFRTVVHALARFRTVVHALARFRTVVHALAPRAHEQRASFQRTGREGITHRSAARRMQ
jgi:hypothetical protein